MRKMEDEFAAILQAAKEIGREYPDGVVLIGGIAVYLHATSRQLDQFRKATHDTYFLISQVDYSDLRDREEVTKNTRLGKSQIIRKGIDFDVYVERTHNLAVPFEDAIRESVVVDEVRIAALEHLLVLKVDAAIDRFGSIKGDKDDRDIVRIVSMMDQPNTALLEPYLSTARVKKLKAVMERPEPFREIASDNSFVASKLRKTFEKHLQLARIVNRTPRLGL